MLQPNQLAFKSAMQFVIEVSTDEQDSIRLTWSKLEPECEVRLVCPAHANQQAYLYHELGNDYAVERDATTSTLVQWLEWLNQA